MGIEREVLAVPEARHRPAQRPAELTCGAARVIGDAVRRVAGEQRDGGGPGRQAAARVKRWPGARLLVLTDAKRVASGMAERRHRDLARPSAPDVDHQEPQRAADRRVRAVAGAEDSEPAVEADAPPNRSVDDDERRREMCRRRDPMEVEGWIAGALGGGNDHRKVFGPTPGQHGVDRGLLDGQPPVVRRHFSEQLVWRPSGTREHPFDALPGRRHDRESVGHAFVEPDLEFVRRHRVRCYPVATVSDNSPPVDNPLDGFVSGNRIMTLAVTKGAILGGQIVPVLKTSQGGGLREERKPAAGRVRTGSEFPVEPHEKSRVFTGGLSRVQQVG